MPAFIDKDMNIPHINTFLSLMLPLRMLSNLLWFSNFFCRNWMIFVIYWWFVYFMFWNDVLGCAARTSLLVLLEVEAFSWSHCFQESELWAFSCRLTWGRPTSGFWVVRTSLLVPAKSPCPSSSFSTTWHAGLFLSGVVNFTTLSASFEKRKFFVWSRESLVARLKLPALTAERYQEWSLRLHVTRHRKTHHVSTKSKDWQIDSSSWCIVVLRCWSQLSCSFRFSVHKRRREKRERKRKRKEGEKQKKKKREEKKRREKKRRNPA